MKKRRRRKDCLSSTLHTISLYLFRLIYFCQTIRRSMDLDEVLAVICCAQRSRSCGCLFAIFVKKEICTALCPWEVKHGGLARDMWKEICETVSKGKYTSRRNTYGSLAKFLINERKKSAGAVFSTIRAREDRAKRPLLKHWMMQFHSDSNSSFPPFPNPLHLPAWASS